MRRVDLDRKQPSVWPFVVGAALLAFVGWGVTHLLRAEPEPPEPEVSSAAADTLPPAAIPAAPNALGADPVPGLQQLAPLDARDAGEDVTARGTVVATGNSAYWLLVDSLVIQVESPRLIRKGDSVTVSGQLREAASDLTRQIADEVIARNPASAGWRIVEAIKLVEEEQQEEEGGEP